jgi:tetratricopeptide (TPR) repeat protein
VVISAIAGTAGVGKTALALHLAHELVPRFPDIQLFVNLHGYDALQRLLPGEVLDQFLRALGVAPEALPTDVDEQAALYRSLLAGRAALVVLDNASSTEQVRPLLPGSPTCLILLTSRVRLAALEGALSLDLDVMDPYEALDFLRKLAGLERVGAEPEAANQIVALCGRLPLALRIAGGRLGARPGWSLTWLADRLAGERTRLKELEVEDLEVRTSFGFSYRYLDAPAARMFRLLGLVAGPDFAPGLAVALTNTTAEEAEELLEALVDTHLLETGVTPGRYRFHDLLRLYARERLQTDEAAPEREAALGRMLGWYLDGVTAAARVLNPGRRGLLHERQGERAGSLTFTRSQALAWSDTEWVNLVSATHQAAESGHNDFAWQIPDALYSFASLRRNWIDWRDACLVGRAAARQAHDPQAEAWMLTGVGVACHRLRRLSEAIDCLQRALAMHRDVGDRRGEAWALGSLGLAHRNLQRFDETVGYLGPAHSERQGFDDASSLSAAGDDPQRFDDAIGYFEQALAIHRDLGDRYNQAWDLHDLGSTSSALGRFDETIGYFQQVLAIHLEMGDRRGEAWALGYLGCAHYCLGRFDEATDCFQGALPLAREVGHRYGEGLALRGLGCVYAALERFDEAIDCLQQALAISREIGDRLNEGGVLNDIGNTYRALGRVDEAIDSLERP